MSVKAAVDPTADSVAARRDALLDRLNEAGTATLEIAAVYLGERLGLYRAMAGNGPMTAAQLAAETGTVERYVREWLEEQTIAGFLEVENPGSAQSERTFLLPPGHVEALSDTESLNYWAPQARLFIGVIPTLPALLDAFRTGSGVPFAEYGADSREGMAEASKRAYLDLMGTEWLPSMPDVHERLRSDPPGSVADIGVGSGWTSIAIAKAYPKAMVDGFDLDPESVGVAQQNVVESGVSDQVHIRLQDAMDPALEGQYDLVSAFFCLHDMSQPVSALRTMRHLAGERGTVLIADAKVAERFLDPDTDHKVERQMYGFSVLHCLPVSMAEQPSAATGTVMRPDILRGYAREAGFRDFEILPIDDDWTTFYRLRT